MNGVQTRFKCKLDVKRCKRFVFPPSSLLPRSNALKTKAIRYFQTDRTLTRIVSPPLVKAPKAFWTVGLVQFFCWFAFMFMWTYTNGSVAANVFDAPTVETVVNGANKVVLDTKSIQYQNAADWVGVLFAVQAIGSVLWAVCIPMFKNRKLIYSLSLVLGGIGFISTYFVHNQYVLFISFLLIGCAWAAMLALPFTILTNALSGGHMGTYLGLFNGTICIPQIVAATLGGSILALFTPKGMLPPEINMLVMAGVMLIIGAVCVYLIKETKGEQAKA